MDILHSARQLTDELTRVVDEINADGTVLAKISTMTITATLNAARVCRQSVALASELVGSLVQDEAPKKRKRGKEANFFNQITVHHGSISIKVFKNGSVHATGCKSPMEFIEVASSLCRLLTDTAGIEASDGGPVRLTAFAVQMINLNFALPGPLFLQDLRASFVEGGHWASYNPDTYPGQNAKMTVGSRVVTALIFKSGKVIITGSKGADELREAYRAAMAVLRPVPDLQSEREEGSTLERALSGDPA